MKTILILLLTITLNSCIQGTSKEYFDSGSAKQKLKDYQGAIFDFSKVIEINPYDAMAYYNRGLAKIKNNDKNGACLDVRKAIELGYEEANDYISDYCQ